MKRNGLHKYTAKFLGLFIMLAQACSTDYNSRTDNFQYEAGCENCVKVDVNDLYLFYKKYDDAFVCTSGEVTASVGGVYLLPSRSELTQNRLMQVSLDISYTEFLRKEFSEGGSVNITGRFSYDESCFGEFESEDSERICAPVQYRMRIKNAKFERSVND